MGLEVEVPGVELRNMQLQLGVELQLAVELQLGVELHWSMMALQLAVVVQLGICSARPARWGWHCPW